jgi:hypothetical protein
MTVTLTSVSPAVVEATGGRLLILTGSFEVGVKHNVHIGPNGDETDEKAYSGIPGQGFNIYPLNATTIRVYTPELSAGGPHDIYVVQPDETDTPNDILAGSITAAKPHYKSLVFAMRSLLPPNYRTGPRNMDVLEPVS